MEYFIRAFSKAAPFVGDESFHYVAAESGTAALEGFADTYDHPCGLFSAALYHSADDYHRGQRPALRWLSPAALARTEDVRGVVVS